MKRGQQAYRQVSETDHFRLTLDRGEAYIPPLGAPSAYGVIVRL
jgi:hypothetical protein